MTASAHENPVAVSSIELFFDLVFVFVIMLGDVFFRWVMGMQPIAVRCFGAVLAIAIGFAGTRWGTQTALAAIALLAIVVIATEQRLESRKA